MQVIQFSELAPFHHSAYPIYLLQFDPDHSLLVLRREERLSCLINCSLIGGKLRLQTLAHFVG